MREEMEMLGMVEVPSGTAVSASARRGGRPINTNQ